jgi:hypothetical protein
MSRFTSLALALVIAVTGTVAAISPASAHRHGHRVCHWHHHHRVCHWVHH